LFEIAVDKLATIHLSKISRLTQGIELLSHSDWL